MVFRSLEAHDRQQLVDLHEECFPVRYEAAFYDKVLGTRWSHWLGIGAIGLVD